MPTLHLRGARQHHLHDLDLDLDLGTWAAVTGPSGSGKTTLVHDTLVAEGQQRLMAAWSARAQQVLGKGARPDLDELCGLPAPVSVGRRSEVAHVRSTVGTRSGCLDLLRLLYAREATDPGGEALRRSHFSFNHPLGACPSCDGLGEQDHVDPELLVADPDRSLREGALVPTLPNGYIVYSQVTPEVLDGLCRDHGFTLDTPWRELTDAQRRMVWFGTKVRKVPFGKHSLESRMRWEGITAKPREEGYYRGLVPVIEETLGRNRNRNILRFVRSVPCAACQGTRLGRPGREALRNGLSLPDLLAQPLAELAQTLAQPGSRVAEVVMGSLQPRLATLLQLGLGHLALQRPMATLSGGEAQRLALVAQLSTELSGQLVAFDEPTLGLHPSRQPGLLAALDALRDRGNTVLTVEHDPDFVRHADRVIGLGPGGGQQGGRFVSDGPPGVDPLGGPPAPPRRRPEQGTLWLRGATLHGLQHVDLPVRLQRLNVVLGPSGAGKSSLVMHTLLPALRGEEGGPHAQCDPLPAGMAVQAVDSSPLGRTSRSTPATWTKLFDVVRRRFAATPEARSRGWGAGHFAFNRPKGRCPTCEGLGVERIRLHLLDDLLRPCEACGGSRYTEATDQVTWRGLSIGEVLQLTVDEALQQLGDDADLGPTLTAMSRLGLGYLSLGQSSASLSRGEGQRIKLATLVAKARAKPTLLVMDEPDRGLHPDDLGRLIEVLHDLTEAGHTVVAISHHRHLWAAADHRVGLREGHLVDEPELPTGRLSTARPPRPPAASPASLTLRGVRTHRLRGFDLQLPHRALIGIVGVSGSGKTSLAIDTLAAEGRRRMAEGMPFEARRFLRRLPAPRLDGAEGLTPTLLLRQQAGAAGPRATIATHSGVGPLLRLLWSRAGDSDTPLSAEHFSPDRPAGACPHCGGRGRVQRCDEALLVTDPERSLLDGALDGTKVGRLLGERGGRYLATLRAAAQSAGLGDALAQPVAALPEALRQLALHGTGEVQHEVTWDYQRGQRTGTHRFREAWPGLCALAEEEALKRRTHKQAAAWAAPLVWGPCPPCDGTGLGELSREVAVGGMTLPALLALPLHAVGAALGEVEVPRQRAVVDALLPRIRPQLDDLVGLGLGSWPLHTLVDDLPDSAHQRLRLASVLGARLTQLTLVLDEPGAGLQEEELPGLVTRLRGLVEAGHTVVVVSHRPTVVRGCDHLVELGPGAGPEGGEVVAQGPAVEVLAGDTATARALRRADVRLPPVQRGPLCLHGVSQGAVSHGDWSLPAEGLVAIVGSGASAALHALADSLTAGRPRGCTGIDGHEGFHEVHQAPLAQHETVLDALGLLRALQRTFAGLGDLPGRAFSFRSRDGRCEACRGTGRDTVALDMLADLHAPCPVCEGRRYRPEVLAVGWEGRSVADVLEQAVSDLEAPLGALQPGIEALCRLGLGSLRLGQRVRELSGGERQRLGLARLEAAGGPKAGELVALHEPSRGLHEADLAALVDALRHLTRHGALVVVHDTRPAVLAGADALAWHAAPRSLQ